MLGAGGTHPSFGIDELKVMVGVFGAVDGLGFRSELCKGLAFGHAATVRDYCGTVNPR